MLKNNLMPIGKFSKSCRLSIKALRHYDREELLKPSFIDPQTGYRYYSHQQAPKAIMIAMLRSLNITIPHIRKMLDSDKNQLQKILNREQQRMEMELSRQRQALNSIQRIAQAGELNPYEIAIRHEPNFTVCQKSCDTTTESMIKDSANLIYEIFSELEQTERTYEHPVMCINEDPDKMDKITVHACVGIYEPFPTLPQAKIISIEGGPMAWLLHRGSYHELGIAYHSLFAWVQERGHEQRAAMREIYLNDPRDTEEDELMTEVMLPVKIN